MSLLARAGLEEEHGRVSAGEAERLTDLRFRVVR